MIARTRAVPAYLANARQQLAAGIAANNTPDWRVLRQFGLRTPLADAEYFQKTLPEQAKADIAAPNRDALVAELQKAGNVAAEAYTQLRSRWSSRPVTRWRAWRGRSPRPTTGKHPQRGRRRYVPCLKS